MLTSISRRDRARWRRISRSTRSAPHSRRGRFPSPKRNSARPEFLAVNPEGRVPTLLIDGQPLTEVAAIAVLSRQDVSRGETAAARRRGGGAGRVVDVVHRRDAAQRAAPRRRGGPRDFRARRHRNWATATGRSAPIPSPIFICSGSIGASARCSMRRRARCRRSTPHYERMMARPAVKRRIEIETALGYELP